MKNSRLTREVAEIRVVEYEQGIYVQERGTLEGDVKLAESHVSRAQDQVQSTTQAFEQGNLSMARQQSPMN